MVNGVREAIVERVNRRFFYGWTIVGTAGVGIFVSGPGQSHTFSVFVEPISRDLEISSATIATAYGFATLAAAFLLPHTGKLIDRFGPRTMLGVIAALLGAACLFFGAAANFLWLAVGFGLLRFLGQGSLMLGCANLVSQWFSRSRGFAMSLMALGFGVSMAVHPPLSQYLVEAIGWRQAWLVLGALTWLLMLPPVLLLMHDNPERLGLSPDGHEPDNGNGEAGTTDLRLSGLTLREALGESTFYVLSFGWCSVSMLVTTMHFYQVSILTDQGVSTEVAARVFAISATTMMVMMPLVGRMFDRVRTRYVFGLGLLVTASSLVAVSLATDVVGAVFYALLFGLNNAFSMTMFGYLWPRYFGRLHLGSIQGTGQLIGVIGASLGPLPVGLAFDLVGSATWTLRLLALYPLTAAIIAVLFLRTPKKVTGNEHLE
ncbi:MAG: MFS transporter [Alphaproteobacteria bacterium]|nr:MFS transporter [Alphaproteobacteria bacterium]